MRFAYCALRSADHGGDALVGWAKALLRRAHHGRPDAWTEWWARQRTLRVRWLCPPYGVSGRNKRSALRHAVELRRQAAQCVSLIAPYALLITAATRS